MKQSYEIEEKFSTNNRNEIVTNIICDIICKLENGEKILYNIQDGYSP